MPITINRICTQVEDSPLGGIWPTPQRGHWFPSVDSVVEFREKIRYLCPENKALVSIYGIYNIVCDIVYSV